MIHLHKGARGSGPVRWGCEAAARIASPDPLQVKRRVETDIKPGDCRVSSQRRDHAYSSGRAVVYLICSMAKLELTSESSILAISFL